MATPTNNRRGVMLTPDAARRVARAVQHYEQGRRPAIKAKPLRTAGGDDGDPVRIGRTTEPWPKGTFRSIELVYEKSCDDQGSGSGSGSGGETIDAYNWFYDVAENAIVVLARAKNGCWYLVEAGSCDEFGSTSGSEECPCVTIGGQDLSTVSGYDASKAQFLSHDHGCLKWIDSTDCGSGS